ncbi:hypothetical protein ACNF49_26300 [Actinomadura sp. ATCC 39365]
MIRWAAPSKPMAPAAGPSTLPASVARSPAATPRTPRVSSVPRAEANSTDSARS